MLVIIAGSGFLFLLITILICCCWCCKKSRKDTYIYKTYSQVGNGTPGDAAEALDEDGDGRIN